MEYVRKKIMNQIDTKKLSRLESLVMLESISIIYNKIYGKFIELESSLCEKCQSKDTKMQIELDKIDLCAELLKLRSVEERILSNSLPFGEIPFREKDLQVLNTILNYVQVKYKVNIKYKIESSLKIRIGDN